MSRMIMVILLCATVLGVLVPRGFAQQISVGGDSATMLMDITLRDADIPEALNALFNTTDGKYQLRLDPSVVGRVSRLQLTATPFEDALNAILGTEFSYQKKQTGAGTFLYTITGRNTGAAKPTTGFGTPLNAPPADEAAVAASSSTIAGSSSTTKTSSSGFPTLSYFTNKTSSTTGATGTAGTAGATGDAAATDELAVVKMIAINFLDMYAICDALGGTTIELFNSGDYGGGSSSNGSSSSGSRSSRNSNNGINTNDNTNNNNTNTTRNNRSTRTTNTNTNNTSNY